MNTINKEIKKQVFKIAARKNLEIVECKVVNIGGKLIVRCLVDYRQGGITLDECSKLNKMISEDIQNSLPELDYRVEVNSPGLDRQLKTKNDFYKVKGKTILLWLKEAVAGKQFIEAKLIDIKEDKLLFRYKDSDIPVSFAKIKLGKQKFRT